MSGQADRRDGDRKSPLPRLVGRKEGRKEGERSRNKERSGPVSDVLAGAPPSNLHPDGMDG